MTASLDCRDEDARRLTRLVLPADADQATLHVIERAMFAAVDVTHECGTEEDTDRAILDTFWSAIGALKREGR